MTASVSFRTTTEQNTKYFFFMGLWDFTSRPKAEKHFQSCANRLFQISLGEGKPGNEDVMPSCSSHMFLQRVSIPVRVGQVLYRIEGKFQIRVHGSDPQSLGATLSSLQLVDPLKSTDCIRAMAGLSEQCTALQWLDYLDSSDLLLCF